MAFSLLLPSKIDRQTLPNFKSGFCPELGPRSAKFLLNLAAARIAFSARDCGLLQFVVVGILVLDPLHWMSC